MQVVHLDHAFRPRHHRPQELDVDAERRRLHQHVHRFTHDPDRRDQDEHGNQQAGQGIGQLPARREDDDGCEHDSELPEGVGGNVAQRRPHVQAAAGRESTVVEMR